jgi:hypothetical protein
MVQLSLTSDAEYDSMSRCDAFLQQPLYLLGSGTSATDPSISNEVNEHCIAEMPGSIRVSQADTASGTFTSSQ